MRRALLPALFVALTGTLGAQTPLTMPLTQPNKFSATITSISQQREGDKFIFKDVRVEFALGMTITADEMTFEKSKDGVVNFSGNVQMTLKK